MKLSALAKTLLLCTTACLLLLAPAHADVLKLASGGEVKGTIEEITFKADGKDVKHAPNTILMLWISQTGTDSLTLKDGTKLDGKLVSVKIKTVGGSMGFAVDDIAAVKFARDPLAEARRAILAAKKAKVAPDDAKGLLELAEWCRKKELKDEAIALAQASLKAQPKGECADKAHKFLGHVQYDGAWMTLEEAVKRMRADEVVLEPDQEPEEAAKEQEEASQDLKKIEAMKEPMAQNNALLEKCLVRGTEIKARQLKSVNTKYRAALGKIHDKMRAYRETVQKNRAALSKGGGTQVKIRSVHTRDYSAGSKKEDDTPSSAELEEAQATLRKLQAQKEKLGRAKRLVVARIARNGAKRGKRVRSVHEGFRKLIAAGQTVSAQDMVAAYRAALK